MKITYEYFLESLVLSRLHFALNFLNVQIARTWKQLQLATLGAQANGDLLVPAGVDNHHLEEERLQKDEYFQMSTKTAKKQFELRANLRLRLTRKLSADRRPKLILLDRAAVPAAVVHFHSVVSHLEELVLVPQGKLEGLFPSSSRSLNTST